MNCFCLLIAVFSLSSHAQPITAEEFPARQVLDAVLSNGHFPALPSQNSSVKVADTPPPEIYRTAFDRLSILKLMGLQLKLAPNHGNVNMDTERKFILLDPETAQMFVVFEGKNTPAALLMLLAHESSHYIYNLYRSRHPELPSFVNEDEEHASVDLIALELLRREGFSHPELELISRTYLDAISEFVKELMGHLTPDAMMRARAVEWWLARP